MEKRIDIYTSLQVQELRETSGYPSSIGVGASPERYVEYARNSAVRIKGSKVLEARYRETSIEGAGIANMQYAWLYQNQAKIFAYPRCSKLVVAIASRHSHFQRPLKSKSQCQNLYIILILLASYFFNLFARFYVLRLVL